MNKAFLIICYFPILFYSCKKENITNSFGNTPYSAITLSTNVQSVVGNEIYLTISFVSLDQRFMESKIKQGYVLENEFLIEFPDDLDFTFETSDFNIEENIEIHDDYSVLIMIDHANQIYGDFDECIAYSIKQLKNNSEIAISGFSDSFGSDEFKIYGNGFINQDSEDKFGGLYDAFNDSRSGTAHPIHSALTGVDYLIEYAKNEKKHIFLYSFDNSTENNDKVVELITYANNNGVTIHIYGGNDYQLTQIASKTNGMYCYKDIRTFTYSIDKLLKRNYFISNINLKITKLNGPPFSNYSWFGYFIRIRHLESELSSRLYFHAFF